MVIRGDVEVSQRRPSCETECPPPHGYPATTATHAANPRRHPLSAAINPVHEAMRAGRGAPGTTGRSSDSRARTVTVHLLAVASQSQLSLATSADDGGRS